MQECYAGMHAALARNIAGLSHLSEEQKSKLLAVEYTKAVAETEAVVWLGSIKDDSTLWEIVRNSGLGPEARDARLVEEANRLAVAAREEMTPGQRWALEEGLRDSF